MTDETWCNCCDWYVAYDDGDGSFDEWCDNPNVDYMHGPPEIHPLDCKFYKEDE